MKLTLHSSTTEDPAGGIALAVGPVVALSIAAALAEVRGEIGATNVALALACVVVLAAVAGRRSGFATAITAAIAFNFFHTQPYLSLRIKEGDDVLTVVLLAVLGVVVSETAHRRRQAKASVRLHTRGEHALEAVAARLVDADGPEAVWSQVETSLVGLLDLAECRFVVDVPSDVAVLPRSGSLLAKEMHWNRSGFQLPAAGAALEVRFRDHVFGHVVMMPSGERGSSVEARRVAVALTDQYAVALALASAPVGEGATGEHGVGPGPSLVRRAGTHTSPQAMSNRSAFMTLFHAVTKSSTNFC